MIIEWDSYYGNGDSVAVSRFEQLYNITFPKNYKAIVEKHNGAFPIDLDVFDFHSNLTNCKETYGVGLFLPFGDYDGNAVSMEKKAEHPPAQLTKDFIIFADTGGGDYLCFDYRTDRKSSQPAIALWHSEGTPGSKNEFSIIADTFDAFLQLLYEDD